MSIKYQFLQKIFILIFFDQYFSKKMSKKYQFLPKIFFHTFFDQYFSRKCQKALHENNQDFKIIPPFYVKFGKFEQSLIRFRPPFFKKFLRSRSGCGMTSLRSGIPSPHMWGELYVLVPNRAQSNLVFHSSYVHFPDSDPFIVGLPGFFDT